MIRVMIADDDVEMLEMLRHIIDWREHGYELAGSAHDPRRLLELPDAPDVLVTDISMPHMDGFGLASALRQRKPDMRVILLTCHDDFEFTQQAIRTRMDDYLLKYALTGPKLLDALARVRAAIPAQAEEEIIPLQNQDVLDVLKYVDAHLSEDITLESAAAHVYKNSSYFSRLFKRETGKAFSEYLIEKRVELATRLLNESSLPIPEICRRVGIESPHYFYRFYQRETGKSPGEIRRRRKQGGDDMG